MSTIKNFRIRAGCPAVNGVPCSSASMDTSLVLLQKNDVVMSGSDFVIYQDDKENDLYKTYSLDGDEVWCSAEKDNP